jgi:hypothetical protein
MPERETSKLVVATNERIMSRDLESVIEDTYWELSDPIPGVRIINTWQIYHMIWLVLTKTESGHYQIFRSENMQNYSLVHDHGSEIYNLFWLDDGHMIFCAADGWWVTTNTGLTWSELTLGALQPQARACAAVNLEERLWSLVAYGIDHKLYHSEYPGGEWSVALDMTAIWTDKWYPAVSGGPAGVLAGAGSKLLRSTQAGAPGTWQQIQQVDGIIKSIVASNQSNTPTFLVVVENVDGSADRFYLSYDLGDSLEQDMTRIDSVSSVASVIPTGTDNPSTTFAVIGKRTADQVPTYRLIEG